jgi:hypothetical protein
VSACQLNEPPFYQCCCTCKHHRPVHYHCTTDWPLKEQIGGCICNIQKGWACVPPDGLVHDQWCEHSVGCELHDGRKGERPRTGDEAAAR